jgi:Flp pilus assembly protein TadD
MLLLLLILLRKKSGWAPFSAMFYFLITLAPASGFFNVYPMRYSFVADHFQYLASIGPIILIAATFEKVLLGFRVLRIILYVLFLLLLAAGTWHHEQIFKDSETLWRDTVRKNPGAYIAHNNLGKILASKGLINEAIIHYMEALKLNPDHAEAHNNLGTALARLNRFDQAMSHFNKALELNPEYSDAHANLGKLLDLLGRTDEALDQYKKALEINPASFITHNNIANLLIRSGQPEKAKFHLLEALKINPDYTPARINLGLLGTRQ